MNINILIINKYLFFPFKNNNEEVVKIIDEIINPILVNKKMYATIVKANARIFNSLFTSKIIMVSSFFNSDVILKIDDKINIIATTILGKNCAFNPSSSTAM